MSVVCFEPSKLGNSDLILSGNEENLKNLCEIHRHFRKKSYFCSRKSRWWV